MTFRAASVTAVVSMCVACTALVGIDGTYEKSDTASIDSGADDASLLSDSTSGGDLADGAPIEASTGPLDAGASPVLVALDAGFAVGAIEVTRHEYAAWLATAPPVDKQPASCAWNKTFAPEAACMMHACAGLGCEGHPQVCIDWCDAYAFCEAMGQRLCGNIGGGAESNADYADASSSQWYSACSGAGGRIYPYGNGYHVGYCNGGDNPQTGCIDGGACVTTLAGSSLRCIADAPAGAKLFDMSGNAAEWTDACLSASDGGPSFDSCRTRGGSYETTGDVRARCAGDPALDLLPRKTAAPDVGARCCSR